MALNFLDELDITSTGDTVLEGFDKAQDNFGWLDDIFHGYAKRGKFRWKDAGEIYLGPGVYHHEGTVNQLLYWNSELTFKCGSAGSNSDSDDLTASAWHYIYIDDSAVVTAGVKLLTETEFRNETTAPTWNAAKHGWYNAGVPNDRCVFAVLTSGASAVLEFYNSGDYVQFVDTITEGNNLAPSTTWTDVTLELPGFSTRGHLGFVVEYVDATATNYVRINGQTGTTGHIVAEVSATDIQHYVNMDVITDSTQNIEHKFSGATTNTVDIFMHGWYFPEGM
jgi:hypothetical protein